MEDDSSTPPRPSAFPATQWTIILEATSSDPNRSREALEKLCASYRPAIVNWFKRRDFYQDPEDLAHSFVAYLIEKGLLNRVTPRNGKFRCFLAASMRNFLWDTWDREGAQKRGGGVQRVPLADQDVEAQSSDDSQFDIDFALLIHGRVVDQLAPRRELRPYVFRKDPDQGWEGIAARLNKTAVALRQEVSRLRRSHWERFRDEVGEIVAPAQKAEETRYLYELVFKHLPLEQSHDA